MRAEGTKTVRYAVTFANGASGGIIGGWYNVTGFDDGNDGAFGPVQMSDVTNLMVPNPNAVTEKGAATATTIGLRLVAAQPGLAIVPTLFHADYTACNRPFALGSRENAFSLKTGASGT